MSLFFSPDTPYRNGWRAVAAAANCQLFAILALSSPGAWAAPPPATQEPDTVVEDRIVVSADRLPVAARTVGSSVTVIDRAEIERRASLTVLELLRTVPGVEITQTGGAGKAASVRIRGGDASQALVLIDGVRVNSPTTGDFDFANLKTDLIESIEVLRGPQATYGSEAVTGVVSITTLRGRNGAHYDIEAEAGSDSLAHLRAAISGRRGNFDYSLAASSYQIDSVSHVSGPGNSEDDPYDNQTASGRFGFDFENEGRLELILRAFEGDTDLDGFFGDDLNASQTTESLIAVSRAEIRFGRRWKQRFEAGVHDSDLLGEDPDTFFNNYQIDTRTQHLFSQSDIQLGPRDTLSFGYAREERQAENVGSFSEDVVIDSVFLQNRWSFLPGAQSGDRVHMSAAVRIDDHEVFGAETTWRWTGSFAIHSDSRIHASVGTSFRAPDFNELFFPGAGDPTLRPETSDGWDLGFEQSLLDQRLTFDVTYFDSDFDQLIDFDFASFRFANVTRASSSGIEASLGLRATDDIHLRFAHTYNDSENLLTGAPLARRPKNRSSLGVDFDPGARISGNLTLIAVRDRVDSTSLPMDDYDRVDVALRARVAKRLQPFVRIENLLDQDYEEIPGFTTPGRLVTFGMRLRK